MNNTESEYFGVGDSQLIENKPFDQRSISSTKINKLPLFNIIIFFSSLSLGSVNLYKGYIAALRLSHTLLVITKRK